MVKSLISAGPAREKLRSSTCALGKCRIPSNSRLASMASHGLPFGTDTFTRLNSCKVSEVPVPADEMKSPLPLSEGVGFLIRFAGEFSGCRQTEAYNSAN